MLETLTKTEKMRLDRLINYVWDNKEELFESRNSLSFISTDGNLVIFDRNGHIKINDSIDIEDYFEIKSEEKITNDTEFDQCVVMFQNGDLYTPTNVSIRHIDQYYVGAKSVYIPNNGKLEIVWEKERKTRAD